MADLEVVKVECKESDCGWKLVNKKDLKKEDKLYKAEQKKKRKKAKKED